MQVSELLNYGKPLNECLNTIAPALMGEMRSISGEKMAAKLGEEGMKSVGQETERLRMALAAIDLSEVLQRGLKDEQFIAAMISRAAQFLALALVVGREQALHIWLEVMAGSVSDAAPRGMAAFTPSGRDFAQCGNPFKAFRQYMIAQMEACAAEGLLESRILEDSPARLAIRIDYCAFAEIMRQLGAPGAARSSCRADELFYPELGRDAGFTFRERKTTIAEGGSCCELCFERQQPANEQE